MNYRLYTYILTELATRKFVVIPLGTNQIIFRIEEHQGKWKFSLKLTSLELKKYSLQAQECFAARSRVSFYQGTDLVIDNVEGPGIYLVKTYPSIQQYSPLKQLIEQLSKEADDFKQLFSLA